MKLECYDCKKMFESTTMVLGLVEGRVKYFCRSCYAKQLGKVEKP